MAAERSEEHTSELQSQSNLVCRLLLEKKKITARAQQPAMPAIGFLSSRSAGQSACVFSAFRDGFAEAGFIEGKNVAIDFFFFNDTATTEIYTLSLHDALPI